MNKLLIATALLASLVAVCSAQQYPERFNVDLEGILSDDQKLAQYAACLLESGDANCDEPGKALKGILGDAIQTDCGKCTEKQKEGAAKAIAFLRVNKPDIFNALLAKYDPSGVFAKNHPKLSG